jgi:uncharacterized protein YbaP (TraB family)
MNHRFLTTIAACALAWSLSPAPSTAQAPAQAPEAAAPAATPAPPLPDADPALWVVRDADTTVYLFGTFHLLDGRPWFNDEVKTAFDASGELVMEAVLPQDLTSLQPLIMRYAVDPGGRTLSSRLSAAENEALGRALAAAGVPAQAFDRFEPWFVAMTLAVLGAQRLGIGSAQGPETMLTAAANGRRMPIGELEGFEFQLRMLDGMPEALQIEQLRETLEKNDEIASKLAPMLAAWSTGDVERLGRLMNEDQTEERHFALHRIIFTRRNAAWARWIEERMERPGTVFLAVGAGHLAGPDSVQSLLAAYGRRAERVPGTP